MTSLASGAGVTSTLHGAVTDQS